MTKELNGNRHYRRFMAEKNDEKMKSGVQDSAEPKQSVKFVEVTRVTAKGVKYVDYKEVRTKYVKNTAEVKG